MTIVQEYASTVVDLQYLGEQTSKQLHDSNSRLVNSSNLCIYLVPLQ